MVLSLWPSQHERIEIQSELANIRVHLVNRQLATSGSLVVIGMLGTHEVRAILTDRVPTSGHDWNEWNLIL